jgi:hypothetical protein
VGGRIALAMGTSKSAEVVGLPKSRRSMGKQDH